MDKYCLYCGNKIVGRADKKFCDDQCRNTHNNRQHVESNNYVRNINNILRKNRRILSELNPGGKTKVHRNKLYEKGFCFGYITNSITSRSGSVLNFCYDQGYSYLNEEFYQLIQKTQDKQV